MSASMDVNNLTRKRRRDLTASTENRATSNNVHVTNDTKKHLLNSFHVWPLIFLFYFTLFVCVRYRAFTFPEPKFQHPGSPNGTFYESNARIHLKEFTSYGPRVVGSKANEEMAYSYILNEVEKIKSNLKLPMVMDIDEQLTSGSFDIAFLSDFVSVYNNMKNIVVKLKGSKKGSAHSVLFSCHFDSAVDSPGAGDNAISCSTMLEILRAITQSDVAIKHNIVFLFNGAEENLLQASHGFITQHPWAKSIKAFVNVDSAGAGGWEVVFQTGPSHPWLVRMYAESIPYPSGSILGQELFQSGLIPSDTDFRIFRDFGEIPGLDIAYISNGYVYHTRNDQERFIEPGCVQRSGENLMALLLKLANSDSLAHPGEEKEGTMIFFDIIGFVMLRYSETVAVVINSALVATILFKVIRKTFHLDKSENHDVKYFKNLTAAILYITMTWLVIFVACFVMAMIVTMLRRNMSWFTHVSNILPVFILPACVAIFLLHEFFKHSPLKKQSGPYSEQLFFDGNMLIWSLLTLYLTIMGIGSAFFPMLFVTGPLLVRESITMVFKTFNWRSSPFTFLAIHLLSLLVPSSITMYVGHAVLVLFIPIMGRSGSEVNSDIAIGIIVAAHVILVSGYMIGLYYICDNMKKLIGVLCGIICIWLAFIVFTPLGFPYKGDYHQPSPMRLLAFHVERRFHDILDFVHTEDSGLWLLPFDYSKNRHLIEAVPELQTAQGVTCDQGPYCTLPYIIPVISLLHPSYKIPELQSAQGVTCDQGPYCTLPYIIPVISLLHPRDSLFLKTAKHNRPIISFKLLNTQIDGMGLTKLNFEVTGGPDHMTLQVQPRDGVSLELWSFSPFKPVKAAMPPDINETTYYVYYSHGTLPDKSWRFSMHFKIDEDRIQTNNGIVDIGVSGHFLHDKHQISQPLKAFLKKVPDWVTPVAWCITYDRYTF